MYSVIYFFSNFKNNFVITNLCYEVMLSLEGWDVESGGNVMA